MDIAWLGAAFVVAMILMLISTTRQKWAAERRRTEIQENMRVSQRLRDAASREQSAPS